MGETSAAAELYAAFEEVPRPRFIPHHKEGCCGSDEYYARLVETPRDALHPDDFAMYLPHVFTEQEGACEAFAWFLPRLLHLWRTQSPREGSCLDNWLFTLLIDRGIFHGYLAGDLREACVRFLDQTFLEVLDDMSSLDAQKPGGSTVVHEWLGIWYTRGQLGPNARLWDEWWGLRTMGRARAAVRYAGCLAMLREEPPLSSDVMALTWSLGIGSTPGWLPENVEEFRRRVTVPQLSDLLRRCEEALPAPGEKEVVHQVAYHLASTPEIAEANLADLDASISAPPEWLHGKR